VAGSKAADSQAADSQVSDSQVSDSQAVGSQTSGSQAADSQAADSQPRLVTHSGSRHWGSSLSQLCCSGQPRPLPCNRSGAPRLPEQPATRSQCLCRHWDSRHWDSRHWDRSRRSVTHSPVPPDLPDSPLPDYPLPDSPLLDSPPAPPRPSAIRSQRCPQGHPPGDLHHPWLPDPRGPSDPPRALPGCQGRSSRRWEIRSRQPRRRSSGRRSSRRGSRGHLTLMDSSERTWE